MLRHRNHACARPVDIPREMNARVLVRRQTRDFTGATDQDQRQAVSDIDRRTDVGIVSGGASTLIQGPELVDLG